MKRILALAALALLLTLSGCKSIGSSNSGVADWILPSTSDIDNSRRFWDQTSDNPYR